MDTHECGCHHGVGGGVLTRTRWWVAGVSAGFVLLTILACGGSQAAVVAATHTLGVTGAGAALSRVTSDPVDESAPSLSPDGRTVLFNTELRDARGLLAQATLVGVDPASGARRTLYTASNTLALWPAWFPDGTAFVYVSNAPGSYSVVRSLSGSPGAAVAVVAGGDLAQAPSGPVVSPNGRRVAFSTDIRGVRQIAVCGTDGSEFTILGEGNDPAWSPDGLHLAFTRTVNNVNQVFMCDAATGSNLVQLTSGETSCVQPVWSPSGTWLLFSSSRGWNTIAGGTVATMNLYAIRSDGTNIIQLTNGDGVQVHPFWGSDSWIYFSTNAAGSFDIFRFRPAGELESGNIPFVAVVPVPNGVIESGPTIVEQQ